MVQSWCNITSCCRRAYISTWCITQQLQIFVELVLHISYCILNIFFILLKNSLYMSFEGINCWWIHLKMWWCQCDSLASGKFHKICGPWVFLPRTCNERQMFLPKNKRGSPKVERGLIEPESLESCHLVVVDWVKIQLPKILWHSN